MNNLLAVSILDAVRLTGMSRSALYVALQAGKIEAKKAGRRTLIPVAALQNYIESLPTFEAGHTA